MTTPIYKETKRVTEGKHRGYKIVVMLAPPDLIGFRFERTRKVYWTTIAACMDMAVRQEVVAKQLARKKARRSKK
jgi:hypothetical protein